MRNRIQSLCAALAALCLCAAPAFALESANTHPGGPFLYPIVTQPDESVINLAHLYTGATARPPKAPYDAVWNAFYSAGGDVAWDRLYARYPEEWDSHKTDYPDRSAAFHLYAVDDDLTALSGALAKGARLQTLMTDRGRLGVTLNSKIDGAATGFCSLVSFTGGAEKPYWMAEGPVSLAEISSADPALGIPRVLLRLDDGLKSSLSASGLDLSLTKAYALRIRDYADGILFDDGKKEFFQPLAFMDYTVPGSLLMPASNPPGEGYREGSRIPMVRPSLTIGGLYSVAELAGDMEKIVRGEWRVQWTAQLKGKAPVNID